MKKNPIVKKLYSPEKAIFGIFEGLINQNGLLWRWVLKGKKPAKYKSYNAQNPLTL